MSRQEKGGLKKNTKNQMESPELKTKISEMKNIFIGLITNWRCQNKG